jgi:hypothetical protein
MNLPYVQQKLYWFVVIFMMRISFHALQFDTTKSQQVTFSIIQWFQNKIELLNHKSSINEFACYNNVKMY